MLKNIVEVRDRLYFDKESWHVTKKKKKTFGEICLIKFHNVVHVKHMTSMLVQ